MGASVTARNQALDGLATPVNVLGFVSLHTADAGTTGANEAAGGGYAAQACSWNAAASGAKTNSTALTFATDNVDVISHFMTRNQAAAGGATFGLGGALSSTVTAASITVAAGALSLGIA